MAIDKIFNDTNVDGIADNIFNSVSNSVSEVKAMQQRKAAENVQLVVESLKKIDTDIRAKFDNVTDVIEKRVLSIQDGRDGINGSDGRDGKDGRNGRDGLNGKQGLQGPKGQDGIDGVDGVSVVDAHIDFDGSLIIDLSTGRAINVGEVVAQDIEERIKIITSGGAGGGGGSGTVTSVAISGGTTGLTTSGSPITTAGTVTLGGTLAVANGGTGTATPSIVAGTNITVTGTWPNQTVTASGGSGSVTSVAATVPSFLSVAGSPITTSGTLAITLSGTALPVANGGTNATTAAGARSSLLPTYATNAGKVLAVNAGATDVEYIAVGGTGTVTSVGGTGTVNGITLTGTVTSAGSLTLGGTLSGVDLTTQVTGTLPVANGGTGTATPSIVAGTNVTVSGTWPNQTVAASGGTGTVTSVAASVPAFLSVAGSPITTSGTLAITLSGTALPAANGGTGITSLGTGVATFLGTPSSANLAAAVTGETGTGALVFATSPTLVTPILGIPTSGTLTNATGLPISTGVSGLGTGVATFLATPSSANLAAALTDETGSGANVFATAPSLSGVVINDGYTEEVFAITDAAGVAISPTNGSIQTWTLGASRTPTAGTWAAGQSITLMINDSSSSFTVTWTTIGVVFVGGYVPTLAPASGFTIIQLWKVGTTIYGALTGQVV